MFPCYDIRIFEKMTQMTQGNISTNGNTTKGIRARIWFVTINKPSKKDYDIFKKYIDTCVKYVWQTERGESGTKHIQGTIEFKNAKTFRSVKKSLPRAHIEKSRNILASFEYCQKSETRLDGPFTKGFPKPIKIIKVLRPWQQKIIDLIKISPDDRTITWVIDLKGGTGKTQLCKYIVHNYNALYLTGKSGDMKYLVKQYIDKDICNRDNLICLFDYTRSIENYVSYQGIEEIKNGIFTSTKYEVETVIMNSPHVIIFANFKPVLSKLSKDRWNVITL